MIVRVSYYSMLPISGIDEHKFGYDAKMKGYPNSDISELYAIGRPYRKIYKLS